jgi:hypothetical protein
MTLGKLLGASLVLLFAASTLAAFQDKPADLSGTWTGTLTPTGESGGPAHLVLTHKGADVTGTCGSALDRQTGTGNGKVTTAKDVTSVTYDCALKNGTVMKFDLKVVGGRLKGNVTLERDGEKRGEGMLDVGRAK